MELQDNNTGICCKCGQVINGASAGNIQSHLKHKHKEFFETVVEEAKRSRRFEEVLNYGVSANYINEVLYFPGAILDFFNIMLKK